MTGFYYEGKGDLVVCNKKAEGPHVLYLSNILPDNCAFNVQYIKGGAHDKNHVFCDIRLKKIVLRHATNYTDFSELSNIQ